MSELKNDDVRNNDSNTSQQSSKLLSLLKKLKTESEKTYNQKAQRWNIDF